VIYLRAKKGADGGFHEQKKVHMADFTSKKRCRKGGRYTAYDLTPMLDEDLLDEIHRIRLDTHAGRGSDGIFHM